RGAVGGEHGEIHRARRAVMRLLQEDALPVAREIESGYVGGEHFRRATGEGRAEQGATPRPSRAARLVIERRAGGRERPAVDPLVEAARLQTPRGEVRAPELELEIALLWRLDEIQHAPPGHRKTLDLGGDLGRRAAGRRDGQRPGPRANVVACQAEEIAGSSPAPVRDPRR